MTNALSLVAITFIGLGLQNTELLLLGETYISETDSCTIRIVLNEGESSDIWNYYNLSLEIENRSQGLIMVDWGKVYLVDQDGRTLFSELDEPNTSTPSVEIPPGAIQSLSTKFHTPFDPLELTLSVLGVTSENFRVRIAPIRIRLNASQP